MLSCLPAFSYRCGHGFSGEINPHTRSEPRAAPPGRTPRNGGAGTGRELPEESSKLLLFLCKRAFCGLTPYTQDTHQTQPFASPSRPLASTSRPVTGLIFNPLHICGPTRDFRRPKQPHRDQRHQPKPDRANLFSRRTFFPLPGSARAPVRCSLLFLPAGAWMAAMACLPWRHGVPARPSGTPP